MGTSASGAVGMLGAEVSDVNVGTLGKYPSPCCCGGGEGSRGETSGCEGADGGGILVCMDGDLAVEGGRSMKDGGREWSLPSSTVGCRLVIRCTSGSSGESAGGSGACSGSGFDRFGSSPLRSAFAIRSAWNLAYFDLAAISGLSGVCHMPSRSRNVAAAWKICAVCLFHVNASSSYPAEAHHLRRGLVRPYRPIRAIERVQRKLLHKRLRSNIIVHSIIAEILVLELLQLVHQRRRVRHAFVRLGVQALVQYLVDYEVVALRQVISICACMYRDGNAYTSMR